MRNFRTKLDYDGFVELCRLFSDAYRKVRNQQKRAELPEFERKLEEHAADTFRRILTTWYGATFRMSQETHNFPVDDTGEIWKPTTIETIYIDWKHYTFVFSVGLD